MKTKDKKLIAFILTTLLLSLAATVLRTIALIRDFDFETPYFASKGLIIASNAVIIVSALTAILYLFVGTAGSKLLPNFHSSSTFITSGLLALTVIFALSDFFSDGFGMITFAILSAMAFVFYLFLNSFLGKCYSEIRGAFSIAPIIFFLLFATHIYFDTTLPLNAPNKVVDLLAIVSAMLFFTAEARLSLGREKWRLYISLGLLSAAFTAYSSLPALVNYFASGMENSSAVSLSITQTMLIFALCVFCTARVVSTVFLTPNKKGVLAEMISKAAEPTEEIDSEAENINQISIDDIINDASESESDK